MPPAPSVPSFPAVGAPVSVLIDYDGTISRQDIGDTLLWRHFGDHAEIAAKDRLYDEGRLGSRELMRWDMDVLPDDADLLRAEAAAIPQDETLPALVAAVRARGAVVEIVSDGLGFYVDANLARLGLADLPVATNANRVRGGGKGMSFPYGHPRCFVCGTCKRERVRLHRGAGRAVVFVGDGTSDRFAANHADVVFAKESLARMCEREGWPYQPWEWLSDVQAWLELAWADGRLPRSQDDFERWRGEHAPAARPFICGPEVWGEGRTTPGGGPGEVAGAMAPAERYHRLTARS